MTIYLDDDFVCHVFNNGSMREVETDVFDGKSKAFIEGYRFVPMGETWINPNGVECKGIMVAPIKSYTEVMTDVAISYLDDDEAETVTALYPEWEVGVAYAVGDRRQYEGLLYRCVQAHTSQADWTPPAVPALWVRTWTDPYPEWVQPTGAHDAYNRGDRCSYKGKHYICTVDGNVYPPDVYGWEEVA